MTNIKKVFLKDRTPEWLAFRENGIGASEVGAILGLSPWKSSIEIFYEKIGMKDPWFDPNASTFWGITLEDIIADVWQYYDGTDEGYIQNAMDKKIIRKCHNVNAYLINNKYPWLFASLDRAMNKECHSLITGEVLNHSCPLEIKTINSYMAKQYEAGLPPYYLAQLFQQMLITESPYGEIAMFDNMRNFEVFPLDANQSFMDHIVEVTDEFWNKRVVPAKKLRLEWMEAKESGDTIACDEIMVEIEAIEPPPDDSEAYKKFMNQRYLVDKVVMKGSDGQKRLAEKIDFSKALIKRINKDIDLHGNELRSAMKEHQEMSFDEDGRVDWKEDKRGNRSLVVRLKSKPTEEVIEKAFNSIVIPEE